MNMIFMLSEYMNGGVFKTSAAQPYPIVPSSVA